MHELTRRRLVEPWNVLADRGEPLVELADTASLPTSATGRRRATEMIERLRHCYQLPAFSMTRAAQTVAGELVRLGLRRSRPGCRATCCWPRAPCWPEPRRSWSIWPNAPRPTASNSASPASLRRPCRPARCLACQPGPASEPANSPNRRSPTAASRPARAARRLRRNAMKLLAIEPQQYMHYYQARYQRAETYGHDRLRAQRHRHHRLLARRALPAGGQQAHRRHHRRGTSLARRGALRRR